MGSSPVEAHRHYLPGMGLHALLPIYDIVVRLAGVGVLHRALVEAPELRGDQRVLDVGCGTGNLLLALARRHPGLAATGIDPDERALARARRKLGACPIGLDQGFAEELPYPDGSFDRVLSTLMFHHLDDAAKDGMLAEVRRVLVPDGVLLLADFGGAGSAGRFGARFRDNVGDAIPRRMRDAGFSDAAELGKVRIRIGRVAVFRAVAR
jgi:ubiquinone/menaquinone biosynthesis C-methylase UbiE